MNRNVNRRTTVNGGGPAMANPRYSIRIHVVFRVTPWRAIEAHSVSIKNTPFSRSKSGSDSPHGFQALSFLSLF